MNQNRISEGTTSAIEILAYIAKQAAELEKSQREFMESVEAENVQMPRN